MKGINKIIFSTFILLLLNCVCFSQKSDVLGWENTCWAMTEQDIIRVLGSKLQKLPERKEYTQAAGYVDYVIPKYEKGDFSILFLMNNKTRLLSEVYIKYNKENANTSFESQFRRLKVLLDQKYGIASYNKDEKDDSSIYLFSKWEFETTTIELSHLWSPLTKTLVFGISYIPTPRRGQGTGRGIGRETGRETSNEAVKSNDSGFGVRDGLCVKDVKILSKPRAAFTDIARQEQITGVVKLRITFLASGEIGTVALVQGLPGGLTQQAMKAARAIRFEPALKNGIPVTVTKLLEFPFIIY
jgi:TonB family protein